MRICAKASAAEIMSGWRFFSLILLALALLSFLVACSTNPVTGERQFTLMSQSQEIALGQQQYPPSQQAQGGAYLLDPAVQRYVNAVGQKLARQSAQPNLPYEFVVLNNDVPNAWALPGGKIAINRGLLVQLEDEAQLASVLGHEIVHAAARHSAEQQVTNLGLSVLAGVAVTQTDNPLYQQAAMMGAGGFQAFYSRENELEADYYGINSMVAAGYDPYGAVELQQTFLRLSQEQGAKSDPFSALFASHPPSAERVKKNRSRAKKMPKGERNRQAFLDAIKQLRRDQPAYDKHQAALVAASTHKNWSQAWALTDEAIRQQPKEARFYLTKGQLLQRDGKNDLALKAFDRAVSLESQFFATRLYRGLLHHQLGNYNPASQDLEASHQILPTQVSSFYLGDIAQKLGNRRQALDYYREAAEGGGDLGREAVIRARSLGLSLPP